MNRTLTVLATLAALVILGVTGTVDGDLIIPALTGTVGLALPSPLASES